MKYVGNLTVFGVFVGECELEVNTIKIQYKYLAIELYNNFFVRKYLFVRHMYVRKCANIICQWLSVISSNEEAPTTNTVNVFWKQQSYIDCCFINPNFKMS